MLCNETIIYLTHMSVSKSQRKKNAVDQIYWFVSLVFQAALQQDDLCYAKFYFLNIQFNGNNFALRNLASSAISL